MRTKFRMPIADCRIIIFLFILQISGFIISSQAQWEVITNETGMSSEEWYAILSSGSDVDADGVATSDTEITPEIRALAHGLENDPVKIFEYVYNEFDYVPMYGLRNGAGATLLAKRGNDFDLCSLLIALLTAADSSSDAHYVVGTAYCPYSFWTNFLDVSQSQVSTFLSTYCRIPTSTSGSLFGITHAWVETTINGTNYVLDPAFKMYSTTEGIDLESAMGFDRTQFVARALSGATEGSYSLQNANNANTTNDLVTMSTNFIAYVRENYPNAHVKDVLGGREIVKESFDALPQELQYVSSTASTTDYTSLPTNYLATVRIRYNGIDETFYGYEIAGKRITIFHSGTSYAPILKVDGTAMATGSATTAGSTYYLYVTMTTPNLSSYNYTMDLKGGYSYAVIADINGASPDLIAQVSDDVARSRESGSSDTSEPVLGGALYAMGLSWLHEVRMEATICGRISDVTWASHFNVGVMAQEEGYYIDMPGQAIGAVHKSGASVGFSLWFKAETLFASALEHNILEQFQGIDKPGASTVKLLKTSNGNGQTTYFANSTNWSTVRSLLTGYSSSQLSTLDSRITASQNLILPKEADIVLEEWLGVGYVAYTDGSYGNVSMTIEGDYSGGHSIFRTTYNIPRAQNTVYNTYYQPARPSTIFRATSIDPVDLITGHFLVENTDLEIGQASPRGLTLARYYDGGLNRRDNGLGKGWTHSLDIQLSVYSHTDPVFEQRQATDAASVVVYMTMARELFENETSLRAWVISALAAQWATDQLADKTCAVQIGNRSLEFIQLPDGSFNPPPGSTASLTYRAPISYGYASTYAVAGDYDGDGETDYGVYDPSLDKFFIAQSTDGQLEQQYGFSSTYPAPGDYDGDGETDIAVIDPSTWKWYINKSSTSLTITQQFGYAGVTNIQADYDGDGDTDIAVYHPTIYTWYLGSYTTTTFGAAGYKAVPADYDGDGKADIAAINTNTWTWYIQYSSSGSIRTQQYGFAGCDAVPADYDGDGKADISVFSSSHEIHFVLGSEFTNNFTIHTATGGSYRVTGDFDGDGDDELAIYVPSAGKWYIEGQNDGTYKLTERFDTVMEFDANNKICLWQNADGQAMRFYYNTYTNLILASDDYGRTLTFTYTGNTQLTSVADSSGRSVSYTYSSGNLATYTDPESKTWTYTYDTNHWITSMRDPLSQMTISNIYDGIGCVVTQVNGSGHIYDFYIAQKYRAVEQDEQDGQTVYTFDDDGRQLSKADPLGNMSYSHYDGQGHVTNEVDPRGFSTVFQYDAFHNLTNRQSAIENRQYVYDSDHHLVREIDPLTNSTSYGYDNEHHLISTTNALGLVHSYDYTEDGLVETVTDPKGNIQTITYDSYGTPATIARTDGGTETLVYNARGDLTSRTDPNTNTTTFTYDKRRLTTSETDPLGYSSSNIYNSAGNLTTNIDRNGNITRTTYTPTYKVSSVQYPDSSIVSNQYDSRDYLVSITDARGNVSSNQYDAAGRVVAAYDQLGHATIFTYDENGNVITTTDALGNSTSNSYDELNRLVSVVDAEGNVSSNEYDAASRLIAMTDAAGKRTEYGYDALGRRTTITRPDGEIEQFEYDAIGNLTAFENAKNNRWGFGYDGMNRKIAETNALGYVTSFSYDDAGNLLSKINANGTTIQYSYDDRNLLTNKQYSGENCVYFYDENRNLTNLISATGTNSFRFDSLNRLVAATDSHGNITSNTFDLAGNRTGLKYPGSLQLNFAFDSANRLTNLTDWASHSTSFDYDEANRLETINYSNSINASFELDGNDRVTGYSYSGSSNFIERSITRNALGFKTVETISAGLEPMPPSGNQFRNHNDGDQLTHNSRNNYNPDQYYDLYAYYDSNGNLTNWTTLSGSNIINNVATFDAENRITRFQTSGSTNEYFYDAQGVLIGRAENGSTNYFVRDYADALKRPLMEVDATGTPQRYYIWGANRLIAQVETNGSTYYYHFDELGSTLALTDEDGNVTDQFSYSPFGQLLEHDGTNETQFTYMGMYGVQGFDDNIYLTLNRMYNADLMKWMQRDPAGLVDNYNLYSYAMNNPVTWLDYTGLETTKRNSWYDSGPSFRQGPLTSSHRNESVIRNPTHYAQYQRATDLSFGRVPRTPADSYMAEINGAILANAVGAVFGPKALPKATIPDDIVVLGRGPLSRLQGLAKAEGGRISTIDSTVPKEIFRQNYHDMRGADKIIQYIDNIPSSLRESLEIGGQYSRAEKYMIETRPDLFIKTTQKIAGDL